MSQNASSPKKYRSARLTRTMLAYLLFLALFFWAAVRYGRSSYLLLSFLLIAGSLLFFFFTFEHRRPQARELVIVAVFVVFAVIGRVALFMLPQFKAMAALVILSGIVLGAESGFLVGALSALVSNIFFTQGPWTLWQMLGFGLLGFLAGCLYRAGWLKKNRITLSVFGFLSVWLLYGGIMNASSVVMFTSRFSFKAFLAMMVSSAPADFIHALATVFFLNLFSHTVFQQMHRLKTKYQIFE